MDEESFQAFYEQTAPKLRAYLRCMLTHQNVVDDLLQESYFRFLKAGLPAAMDRAHRKNYLYRVATNLVHDHRRSRRMEPLSENLSTISNANSLDKAHDVGRAFDRLKPRERDALWLAYVECFDHREIAAILQVRAASIRPMLSRARAKFADILRRRNVSD
jgi:RNA polymerase sigma-70 factor, ECF subfamily